jgi:gliding motility-associated-like protein
MYLNQTETGQKLQGGFAGSFIPLKLRKALIAMLSIMMLTLGSSIIAKAQVLQVGYSPSVVCEGNNAIINITPPIGLPPGVTVLQYVTYFAGSTHAVDSAVVKPPFAPKPQVPVLYTPGFYHPYVVAELSNGSKLTSAKMDLTVYYKPIPYFVNITPNVQCFKGNNVCLQNATIQAPQPSSPVVQYIWEYGDAFFDSVSNPIDVCHTYGFPGTFIVSLRAIDSLGCRKDTFLPPAQPVEIKPILTPKFSWIARSGPCFISNYLFTNATPVNIDALTSFRWEFGDDSIYQAYAPFSVAERAYFDTIGHDYVAKGDFNPLITVTDTTGCTDSIRYTPNNSPINVPRNILVDFDVVTYQKDGLPRDSVCAGTKSNGEICFKQSPILGAKIGDFTWSFNDPDAGKDSIYEFGWEKCHQFKGGMKTYNVTLTLKNVCPGQVIKHYYTAGRTFIDNAFIDKYIYANNDLLDSAQSLPILLKDTVIYPKYKKAMWNLVYLNDYNVSEGDTLYFYKRIDKERPIFYLGDSLAIDKTNGTIKDSVFLKPNWMHVDSFNVYDTNGLIIPDTMRYDTFAGYLSYGYGVRVIGPVAAIETPPPFVIAPQEKNQCGPSDTVNFLNTSAYYKSRKMYRRWDFDDDFAPRCTSYSIPKFGFPPVVSTTKADSVSFDNKKTYKQIPADTVRMWSNAEEQYKNSDYYFIANGLVYGGKMNCKFSYDTLPRHVYLNWDTVYRYYSQGKDFMPWTPNRYGPGKRPISPADSLFWGKPVYLNPETGEWSLTQSSGPAPYGLWTRIDTMDLGLNDLDTGEVIRGRKIPDPFRSGLVDDKGKYNIIAQADIRMHDSIAYFDPARNETYTIRAFDTLPGGDMTFYKYVFYRTIIRCLTVRMKLSDSVNNETGQSFAFDPTELDTFDCNSEATVQLSFARADAHGLGKEGLECPGDDPEGFIKFRLDGVNDFPGIRPQCGQTFILLNLDSLADRMDNTPCDLDGFTTYTGGTTPGGLSWPAFNTSTNFNPQTAWTSPSSTLDIYHYGAGTASGRPAPADTAQGFISIGVIVGSGCRDTTIIGVPLTQYYNNIPYYGDAKTEGTIIPNINIKVQYGDTTNKPVPGADTLYDYAFSKLKNYRQAFILGVQTTVVDVEYTDCKWPKCLSDTVWYHRFLRIQNLAAGFDFEPLNPRLRHVGETIKIYYRDSVQDDVRYSEWAWGDGTTTVDSFNYAPAGQNITDGFYTNGYRRVRYNWDITTSPYTLIDSTVWPIRSAGVGIEGLKPRTLCDTILAPNMYKMFSVVNRGLDSIVLKDKCYGNLDTIPNKDTMKYYPISQIIDTALMFLPLSHKYVRTSWEVARKAPNATISVMEHHIRSRNGCRQDTAILVTIGVIDSFAITNRDGVSDTLFCQDEPVYFVDSIRYWRNDGRFTSAINGIPAITRSPAGWFDLQGNPYEDYQFDSADFWRQDVGDPRVIQDIKPRLDYKGKVIFDTVVAERVYWDYGDGSPIDSSVRPVHAYKTYGRFKVTMVSRDSLGGFDTSYGYLNVSVPVAKIGFTLDNGMPKDVFNCGDFADMIDSSAMDPQTTAGSLDSVKTNYWWFGDTKPGDTMWQTKNNFFPKHPYRTNGSFKVKLVSESFLGCKDTTYDTIFIRGPRPQFRAIDTVGCVPFTVTLVNMADSTGQYVDPYGNTFPSDTPTLTTYFDWGDTAVSSPQTIVTGRRDTVRYTYTKPGTYYIYGYGSDAVPGGQNSCDLVAYPDTNSMPKVMVVVVKLEREILANKDIVCKDPQLTESAPIVISNNSDTSFASYSYYVQRKLDSVFVDSVTRAGIPDNFSQTFPDTGYYRIIAVPGFVNHIPMSIQEQCKVPDTLNVRVVTPYPAFEIDTMLTPVFKMNNLSDTTLNNKYEWVARKQGSSTVLFSKSGTNSSRDFTIDLQNDTGTYIVCLTSYASGINPAEACTDSVCHLLKNNYNADLQIPNVFSPNGDGANDVMRIPHESVESYKMTIYNRWGAKVFETTNVDQYWNGKVHNDGAESPAGVYYYIAEYKLRGQDTDKTKTGTVTLIR